MAKLTVHLPQDVQKDEIVQALMLSVGSEGEVSSQQDGQISIRIDGAPVEHIMDMYEGVVTHFRERSVAMSAAREHAAALSRDIRDVSLWLTAQFPDVQFYLAIERNYNRVEDQDLAYAVVYHDDRDVRQVMRSDATRAMEALGYGFSPTGGDVFMVEGEPAKGLSKDQRNICIERVHAAISGKLVSKALVSIAAPTDK